MSATPSLPPLICDLDGTLVRTDTLFESFVKLIKQRPLLLLALPFWLLAGRSQLKSRIADHVSLDVGALPYREDLVGYLKQQRQGGRRVVLATAADHRIASRVAAHLGLFDMVLATEPGKNLKGERKLQAIQEQVGSDFVYAGDCAADLSIWRSARGAILVDVPASVQARLGAVPVERRFSSPSASLMTFLKAARIHQWVKNVLVFVPLLTSFGFTDTALLGQALLAFLAFSLTASATYLVNDLWDLESDRRHPRKRERPMAKGTISIAQAFAMAGVLLTAGLGTAWLVSKSFTALLLCYLVLTSAYSWHLKSYVLVDAVLLSVLYTLRIIAGAAAIHVSLSNWLLAFSVFLFLSLALVKRCTELEFLAKEGHVAARGRDYQTTDLAALWPLGIGAGMAAVVVLGLFVSAPEIRDRYASPQLLWLMPLMLVYWIGRIWIKTSRGEMHDDPIVYALRDRASRLLVVSMTAVVLLAHFLKLEL